MPGETAYIDASVPRRAAAEAALRQIKNPIIGCPARTSVRSGLLQRLSVALFPCGHFYGT
jgi:hypothetical protein